MVVIVRWKSPYFREIWVGDLLLHLTRIDVLYLYFFRYLKCLVIENKEHGFTQKSGQLAPEKWWEVGRRSGVLFGEGIFSEGEGLNFRVA